MPTSVEELPVPTARICVALENQLVEFAKQGYRSVQHPVHKKKYIPLWVVRAWKWANAFLKKRDQWSRCLVWLINTAGSEEWTQEFLHSVRETVLCAPWMAGFPALQRAAVSSITLATMLLSFDWLNDDTMNCVIDVFRSEKGHSISSSGAPAMEIATAYLSPNLVDPASNVSRSWAEKLTTNPPTHLFLPCNYANIHWFAIDVDICEACIRLAGTVEWLTKESRKRGKRGQGDEDVDEWQESQDVDQAAKKAKVG